ncbi:pyridoxal phosphate-dependent transferase [Mycena pura]|uniref:Pyridoxal phosphate-dependent transferase n=1 Tax=Mycena pura TaxID=153505 RepID=A0AAD6YHI1_9AGAR|nr:pyridoxal phosphate-dependent transferase [Mycena pura]
MAILLKPSPPTGLAIPPNTPHSVLNSLPEWDDNIMIVQGRGSEILKETTYPRFNIHPCVEELAAVIVKAIDASHQGNCFLFPTFLLAQEFRSYIQVNFPFSSCDVHCATEIADAPSKHQIFAVLFSAEMRDARKFYIFSGNGISPRLAEVCLQRRGGNPQPPLSLPSPTGHCFGEYYSRHTPLDSAEDAKRVIRNRFSGMVDGGLNIRGVPAASPEDVYLFSSGMQAIWRVYNLLAGTLGSRNDCRSHKVAHVNLLYCDSYKFLELPNSAGYHFFTNDALNELESLLATGTPDQPAILALYTDFPGNPHLRSADLARLRALADRYNIPIIVDETAGGYLNTQTLPYCDIVVSSLTKLFSGMANVLGGATILNPASRFYPEFKKHMEATYEDTVFDHDALLLEMHSREYAHRTAITSHNAEMLSDVLHSHSVDGGSKASVLKAVHYPKYRTRDIYDRYRNPLAEKAGLKETGYGNLLSVTFTSVAAAKAFYCALQCYKGATLGTVFTLATAFSVIAFPPEKMQWIEDRGVEESLIRFSVGMEDTSSILKCVLDALLVAQRVQNAVE